MLLQVMKYEDPLNWKKINALEILLYKAKLTWASLEKKKENHYLWGSKVVEMTSLILLCIFHATRHRKWLCSDSEVKKEKRREKVLLAICLKKTGSITNLGNREGQVQHCEVII